ncbi:MULTISPECIES: hypothetical protein [Bacillus]|nr:MULTISPECIES: hypothetical protein [Bacillus]
MDLYCERVFFNYKRQAYEVVFDFNKMSDLKELAWFLNIEILKESSKTLLILNDVKVESYQGPKAGC